MSVSKRKIFYIGGFDPRGIRHYHEMYKNESLKAAQLHDCEINVGRRQASGDNYKWDVTYKKDNAEVETEYVFLKWDDIVRKRWIKNPLKVISNIPMVYFRPLFNGSFKKCVQTSWPPAVSYILPFLLFTIVAILSISGAFLVAGRLEAMNLSSTIALGSAFISFLILMFAGIKLMEKLNAFWMLRLYVFCHNRCRDKTPEVEERLDSFAKTIAYAVKKDDFDEILIISHSAGTIIFMTLLAKLMKKYPEINNEKVKIITIGQCIPLQGFLVESDSYRQDIIDSSKSKNIWLDVTAPADGVCFALEGPFVGVTEITNENMKVVSARFHTMFEEEKYKKLKKDRFLTHFLYLMAADKDTDYDFFKITAGNLAIEERFSHVKSKPFGIKKFKKFGNK